MILADTSLWIDHLHRANAMMSALLANNEVLMHPFVFGELAMGSLRDRDRTLHSLQRLPEMLPARDSEVLAFVTHTTHQCTKHTRGRTERRESRC